MITYLGRCFCYKLYIQTVPKWKILHTQAILIKTIQNHFIVHVPNIKSLRIKTNFDQNQLIQNRFFFTTLELLKKSQIHNMQKLKEKNEVDLSESLRIMRKDINNSDGINRNGFLKRTPSVR